MWRMLIVLVLLLAAGFLLWEFLPVGWSVWSSTFDLTVRVTNSSPEPIRAVSCEAVSDSEQAEYILEHLLPPEIRHRSATADPFTGQPLTVAVPLGGRDSPLGRELRRSQFRHLVVIVELEGGKRSGKLVEIPDCRVSRSLEVRFP